MQLEACMLTIIAYCMATASHTTNISAGMEAGARIPLPSGRIQQMVTTVITKVPYKMLCRLGSGSQIDEGGPVFGCVH